MEDAFDDVLRIWGSVDLFLGRADPPWEVYALGVPSMFVWFAVVGAMLGVAGRMPVVPSAVIGCFPFFGVMILGIAALVRRQLGYAESYAWNPRGYPAPSRRMAVRVTILTGLTVIMAALAVAYLTDFLVAYSHTTGPVIYLGSENFVWQYFAITGTACVVAGVLYVRRRPLWAAAVAVTVGCMWWFTIVMMWFTIDLILTTANATGGLHDEVTWLLGFFAIELPAEVALAAADLATISVVPGLGFWFFLGAVAGTTGWGCALVVLEVAAMRWEDPALGSRHWALT